MTSHGLGELILIFWCIFTDIDDCKPDSCNKHGQCIDGINAFTCKCDVSYKGTRCTEEKGKTCSVKCASKGDFNNNLLKSRTNCSL